MITASLIIISLLFGIYGWLAAMEFGVALARLAKSADTVSTGQFFTPLWEVTNVFLVFGFTAFVIFFNNALVLLSHGVISILSIGLVALVLRAIFGLYTFYAHEKPGLSLSNLMFALAAAAVPLSFGAAAIYLLIGMPFWNSKLGWVFFGALCLGLCAVSLTFARARLRPHPPRTIRYLSRAANVVFCLTVAIGLQLAVNHWLPHLSGWPYGVFVLLSAGVVFAQVLMWFMGYERYLWWYLSVLALIAPLAFALANRPYLIYPTMLLQTAYGAAGYDQTFLISLAVMLPLISVGLVLLWWLLVSQNSVKDSKSKTTSNS